MQEFIRQFVKICADELAVRGPLYEFGAYQVKEVAEENLRPIFPDIEYIGTDMRAGPGVDIVLNLHDIDLPDDSAECVLCLETLEHVEYPRRALSEIYRILSPTGIAIISSQFYFPIHNYPNDYWRFTPEGFRSLLKEFNYSAVFSFGEKPEFPASVVGVGIKGKTPDNLETFVAKGEHWEKWNTAMSLKLSNTE